MTTAEAAAAEQLKTVTCENDFKICTICRAIFRLELAVCVYFVKLEESG